MFLLIQLALMKERYQAAGHQHQKLNFLFQKFQLFQKLQKLQSQSQNYLIYQRSLDVEQNLPQQS